MSAEWMADLVRRIKSETGLAVTLSLGERPLSDLQTWREAGADRYFLRFETSNRQLYEKIHPPFVAGRKTRIELLRQLDTCGYEVGSGIMVGLPGQTYPDLVRTLDLFRELDLDMIGVGPYLPHPHTPLGLAFQKTRGAHPEQVPNTVLMTLKMIALTRILCPTTNIPATTALAAAGGKLGFRIGLRWGANVFMPAVTPSRFRWLYQIYPPRTVRTEPLHIQRRRITGAISAMGRQVDRTTGDSIHYRTRRGLKGRRATPSTNHASDQEICRA